MYAQSNPAPGKPLSAYDIYIQENIARREALRVKPHPYTPKNEPIRTEVNEAHEPVKDTATAKIPIQPQIKKKRVQKKPVAGPDAKPENLAELIKPKLANDKSTICAIASRTLLTLSRAGPL